MAFATEERAGVLDRYVEHSDRAKVTEGVAWGGRSRSTGEKSGLGLLLTASLLMLVIVSPVHADRQAAARRLLAITDVAREFELAADRQTEAILRTYADIVSTSANRTLPDSIRQEIARCYQQAFAWERFEAGIAAIFADNFSEAELQLLLDFFSDRSVPPPMIGQFRAIIARAEAIEQQTIDYLFSQTEGCDESNVRLVLEFLGNP